MRGFRVELLDFQGRATAVFAFAQEFVRIGSDGACEVCFPDADMAPVHGLIRTAGDRFLVAPGDSMRPLLVNGGMVEGMADLRPGDVVQAAQRRLRFLPDSLPAAAVGLPAVDLGGAPRAPVPSAPPPLGMPARVDGDATLPGYALPAGGLAWQGPPVQQGGAATSVSEPAQVSAYTDQVTGVPKKRSPLQSPAVRAAFMLMFLVVVLAAAKVWFSGGETTAPDASFRPKVKALATSAIGTKEGHTDAEIQSTAEREYKIALKRIEEHNLKDENLKEALNHLDEADRLLKMLPHELPVSPQVRAKRAEALTLQEEKYNNIRFRYLQLVRMGQYKEAKVQLQRILRVLDDTTDPRFQKAERELVSFDDTMRADR